MSKKFITQMTIRDQLNEFKVRINDQEATRLSIINFIKNSGVEFTTNSDWGAEPPNGVDLDWDFKSIVIHHAGHSFNCASDSTVQLKEIEKIDVSKFKHISYHYGIDCSGRIYELLNIRFKGASIKQGNTGVVAIVLMANLAHPGEAYEEEYKNLNFIDKIGKLGDIYVDATSTKYETVTPNQSKALVVLISALKRHFGMTILGGHKEFQVLANKEGRACPGSEGMKVVNNLRPLFNMTPPNASNYPHKHS